MRKVIRQMRPSRITAVVILFCFAFQIFGCTSIKLVRPGQKPERLKSKKITVVTIDQKAYTFSEIRVYSDTLYGVFGIPFPEDRANQEVITLPFSDVESIYYRGHSSGKTLGLIWFCLTTVAAAAAIAIAAEVGGNTGSW